MDKAANDNRGAELISILSSTLANIDVEYEFELVRIRVTSKPDLRATILERCASARSRSCESERARDRAESLFPTGL
jgi:hypothetical protein